MVCVLIVSVLFYKHIQIIYFFVKKKYMPQCDWLVAARVAIQFKHEIVLNLKKKNDREFSTRFFFFM